MIAKGNHVKFARFVLLAVSEEAKTWFGFCDIQNNRGLGKGYQPSASADYSYLDLDYSGHHKNLIQ